jgi:hypothetical protein
MLRIELAAVSRQLRNIVSEKPLFQFDVYARLDRRNRGPGFDAPNDVKPMIAIGEKQGTRPRMVGSAARAIQKSGGNGPSVSPKKPGGAMPAMVTGAPSITNVEPISDRSEPIASHARYPITATGAAPGRSSDAEKTDRQMAECRGR